MEKYQVGQLCQAIRIETHYLPCLAYFTAIYAFDTIWLEAAEHYNKQSYRNRCYVLTANGTDRLTVPVVDGTHKQLIRDVRIDYGQAWPDRHWRCLTAAYGKAPFFEYYADDLERLLRKKWDFLFDLNLELLTICLQWLGWKKSIRLTEAFDNQGKSSIFDAHGLLSPRGSDQTDRVYRPFLYLQNFGNVFVPNLSVLDLLFCHGPLATEVIKRSRVE